MKSSIQFLHRVYEILTLEMVAFGIINELEANKVNVIVHSESKNKLFLHY